MGEMDWGGRGELMGSGSTTRASRWRAGGDSRRPEVEAERRGGVGEGEESA